MRPLPLALVVLLTAASAHAAPSTPLSPLQRGPEAQALRQIEATRPLPGASFSAVKVTGRQDLYFLSGDGRILIKGTAYDLWSGQTLSTIEDVAEATTRINLDGFAAIWPQLDPTLPTVDPTGLPTMAVRGFAGVKQTGFRVAYAPSRNPTHEQFRKVLEENKVFELVAEGLNKTVRLPRTIDIQLVDCDTVNAFYDPNNHRIIVCYELLSYFVDVFKPTAQPPLLQSARPRLRGGLTRR